MPFADGTIVAKDPAGRSIDVKVNDGFALPPLPLCIHCGGLARPNILMFGDKDWISTRSDQQEQRYRGWVERVAGRRLAVIEFGAGTAVPTVRWECERAGGQLIRVNPRDPQAPRGSIVLPVGALQATVQVDRIIAHHT